MTNVPPHDVPPPSGGRGPSRAGFAVAMLVLAAIGAAVLRQRSASDAAGGARARPATTPDVAVPAGAPPGTAPESADEVAPPAPAPAQAAAGQDADPRRRLALDRAASLTNDPLFRDLRFEVRVADPYVVCQQYDELTGDEGHKNPGRVANAARSAERYVTLLAALDRRFRELFAERFELPELRDEGRVLVAAVAWDRESFVRLYRRTWDGDPPPRWAAGSYSRSQRRLLLYLGTEALTCQDELPAAHDRIQKFADGAAMSWGTIQLLHEYGAIVRRRALADQPGDAGGADDAVDEPARQCLWFDNGLAEFLGPVEVERSRKDDLAGAPLVHNRLPLDTIGLVRGGLPGGGLRKQAKLWTIPELLEVDHPGDLFARCKRLHPQNSVTMMHLFNARAWGLVHFLWFYDEGRYRSGLLDFMETVLRGEQSPEAFARCLGRKDAADWAGIDAEFEWYWDRCMARPVGWGNPASRTRPYNTDTEPPTGRYAPDVAPHKDDE